MIDSALNGRVIPPLPPRGSVSKSDRAKARYHRRRAIGEKCAMCSRPWSGPSVLCEHCKAERRNRNNRTDRSVLKRAALNAYGGPVCKCCGESDQMFLTLDHVNNDGSAHRKRLLGSNLSGWGFYQKLKNLGWPNDPPLQVLCYNCNNGKRANKGVCPHVAAKVKAA